MVSATARPYLPQALRLAGGDAAPSFGAAGAKAFARRACAVRGLSFHFRQGRGQWRQAKVQGSKRKGLGRTLPPAPLARAAVARREHRPCSRDLLQEANAPQHLALQVLCRRGAAGVPFTAIRTGTYEPSLHLKSRLRQDTKGDKDVQGCRKGSV